MLEKYVIMCPQALGAMQFTISEVQMLAHSEMGGERVELAKLPEKTTSREL